MHHSSFCQASLQTLGGFSDRLFRLFYDGRYAQAIEFVDAAAAVIGSERNLPITDFLIYKHCHLAANTGRSLEDYAWPSAPSIKEVQLAAQMEQIKHRRNMSLSTDRNILSKPQRFNRIWQTIDAGHASGCVRAIETGTYLGLGTYALSGAFALVDTIEADQLLYKSATSWLAEAGTSNIRTHLGDSGALMPKLLQDVDSKVLVFLDAHYSQGITSSSYGVSPLAMELKAIFSKQVPCTVIIDDVGDFGKPGYPTFQQVFESIPEGWEVRIINEAIVATY